jgi:hypothetical protein
VPEWSNGAVSKTGAFHHCPSLPTTDSLENCGFLGIGARRLPLSSRPFTFRRYQFGYQEKAPRLAGNSADLLIAEGFCRPYDGGTRQGLCEKRLRWVAVNPKCWSPLGPHGIPD